MTVATDASYTTRCDSTPRVVRLMWLLPPTKLERLLEFRVLGPVSVVVNGARRQLRRKATTLLALLLNHANRPIQTDTLIERLWLGRPPRTADAAVRVHLSELRAAIRPEPTSPSRLATTRHGYLLTVEPDELDAARFERTLDRACVNAAADPRDLVATLRAGLNEWAGTPYEGLDDLAELLTARAYLEGRLVELRVALADAELERGRYERVAAETAFWLTESPTSESLARRHVLALYRSGNQVDALRAWRRFTRQLVGEYGLEPTGRFRMLEQELLQQSPALDATPPPHRPSTTAAAAAPPTLVQRDEVLREVLELAGLDADRRPPLITISGAAGMGKSALLEALRAQLHEAIVVSVRHGERPLAPIYDLLHATVPSRIPTGPFTAEFDCGIDHVAVLAGVVRSAIQQAGVEHVLVDDADELDRDSVAVFRRVIEHRPDVLWVGTIRSTASTANPFGLDTSVLARVRTVSLSTLADVAVAQVLRHSGVHPLPDSLVSRVVQLTGGVPFLVVITARHLAAGRPVDELPLQSIAHVARLLEPLGTEDRVLLELASVESAGPLDLPTLAAAAEVRLDSAIDTAERAIAAGLLDDRFPDGVSFRHAISREAIAASMSGPRRSVCHERIACALIAAGRTDAGRIARHLRAASRPELAADAARWTAREADAALVRGAVLGAGELYATAARLGRTADLDGTEIISWELRRCDAKAAAGSLAEAHALAAMCAEEARQESAPELFAEAAVRLAGPMIPTGSARDLAEELLVEALEWLTPQAQDHQLRVAEALLRALVASDREAADRLRTHVRPVLLEVSEDRSAPGRQAVALLGLRSLTWSDRAPVAERVRRSSDAAKAAYHAGDPALRMATHRVHVADLFEAGSPRLGPALTSYTRDATDCGAEFHCWLALRISAAWGQASGDHAAVADALADARTHADGIDPAVGRRADLEFVFVDHMLAGTLGELIPLVESRPATSDEVAAMTGLAVLAIRAAAGQALDGEIVAAMLQAAPRGPLRAGAATFVALALPALASHDLPVLAGHVIDELRPLSGAMCVLDGGVASLGPVDTHLARCLALAGDRQAADYHRRVARTVAERFAPAWVRWGEGEP